MNFTKTALTVLSVALLSLPLQSVGAADFNHQAEGVAEGSEALEISYLEKLEFGDGAYMPRFIGERMTVKPENERIVIALEDREGRFRLALRHDDSVVTCYASLEPARDSCRILRR